MPERTRAPEVVRQPVLSAEQIWYRHNVRKVDIGDRVYTLVDGSGNPVRSVDHDVDGNSFDITYTCGFNRTAERNPEDALLAFGIYPTKGNVVDTGHEKFFGIIIRRQELVNAVRKFGGAGFVPIETIQEEKVESQEPQADLAVEIDQEPLAPTPIDFATQSTDTQRFAALPREERLKQEKDETARVILAATSELLNPRTFTNNPQKLERARAFLGEAVSRFEHMGITEQRLNTLGSSGYEKSDPTHHGVTLSVLDSSFRGENVLGDPVDPMHVVPTLVLTVYHTAQLLGREQKSPNIDEIGKQINTIAAIRFQLENINRGENSPFAQLLRNRGIKQVRLDIGSWRYRNIDERDRPTDKYIVRAPLIGCDLTKESA